MAKKYSKEKIKRINKITWIASAVTAIFFAVLFNVINMQEADLLKDGLREDVVVVQKYKSGSNSKYSTEHYYIEVDWFTVVKEIPYYKTKDTVGLSNADKMSNTILSKVFKDKGRKKIERLNKSIKLDFINGDTYNNVSSGAIVTLVYFKDKPEEGRLLRELE